jgi:hypothetical protein|tara:strand:- start:343 stop:567 length:225 start_codon:yes stop_codon:yes gene_type:complete
MPNIGEYKQQSSLKRRDPNPPKVRELPKNAMMKDNRSLSVIYDRPLTSTHKSKYLTIGTRALNTRQNSKEMRKM